MNPNRSVLRSRVLRPALFLAASAAAIWGAWTITNTGAAGDAKADTGSDVSLAAGALSVDVSGVRSDTGTVIGTLCLEGEKFPSGCTRTAESQARQGVVMLRFENLRGGDYALALYHDENSNARLELGAEGVGFSNNANLAYEPPKFESSRIVVDGETRIRVRIKYSL